MTPAPVASELHTLLPADARAFGVPGGREFRVRVSRRRESSRPVVARAVPHGSARAASQVEFLAAVREHPELGRLRRDGFATLYAVAKVLAWSASWETMTSRPTWALLEERTGPLVGKERISRATVARALRRLQEAGLVGVVATGRSGRFTPAARDAGVAEAAVYVLCTPSPLAPVDEDETPTELAPVSETHPPHARARQQPSEPLRGLTLAAPVGPGAPVGTFDEQPLRPADPSPDSRLGRLGSARALQERLPVLRRISEQHVASIVREFALAGWSVSELVVAIDRRPDGTTWPHDGATGVGNVGAWLAFRLGAWRDPSGTVRPSPSARVRAERLERAARRRAEDEAAAELRPASQSPAFAEIRAMLAARRTTRPAAWVNVEPPTPDRARGASTGHEGGT